MSGLSIWDQALSQAEIESYLTLSPTGLESGLVGYWNFNEGEGNVLTDLSTMVIMDLYMGRVEH